MIVDMKAWLSFAVVLFLAGFSISLRGAEISVHSDFEGGSVDVLEIDAENQSLKIFPADHPGKGWRCWWYFRVEGLSPEKSLTLEVGSAPWATPDRAHISDDGGKTWRHSGAGVRKDKNIIYTIPVTQSTMWFAWGPPFTPEDSKSLVDSIAANYEVATSFNLATTREDRPTPALKITAPGDASNRRVIWFQARQHAWESGSSWVAKGLADFLVSDVPAAIQLREKAEIYLVPIMDIDNTARGAGGKNQKPQDHNRDWSDAPHWHAVAAAQKYIKKADEEGRFALFVDLHNPAAGDRFPYYYIPSRDEMSEVGRGNLNRFLALSKLQINGPLRYMGRATESGSKYDPKNWTRISKNWVIAHTADEVVAATLETSWNTPASTIENYETVGRQLGQTASIYLLENQ